MPHSYFIVVGLNVVGVAKERFKRIVSFFGVCLGMPFLVKFSQRIENLLPYFKDGPGMRNVCLPKCKPETVLWEIQIIIILLKESGNIRIVVTNCSAVFFLVSCNR